jgi:hypothetical protein
LRGIALLDVLTTRVLHRAARLALRVQSPLAARRTVARLGSLLRPFADADEARAAGESLMRGGTCLSRSLAVAARLPGSSVVIGVDVWRSARMSAHAWVQMGARTVYPQDALMDTEALAVF